LILFELWVSKGFGAAQNAKMTRNESNEGTVA
jgi:hypothetical protein